MKLLAIIFFILAFGIFSNALGCTCGRKPMVDTVFENVPFAVVLKLEGVGRSYKYEKNLPSYAGREQSITRVQKVYKGDLSVGEKLVFAQLNSAACGWSFSREDIGKEFLFYLSSAYDPVKKVVKPVIWSATICGRSSLLDVRQADVAYMENYAKVKGKTRISGIVLEPSLKYWKAVAGHKVVVEGEGKRLVLTTDKNGVYEVYDLEPGTYKVTSEPINGHINRSSGIPENIELREGSHVEKDFMFINGNSLQRFLKSTDGFLNPMISRRDVSA